MKKRLWQIHSWLGLIAGLGLLVIGLTGSLLVFRDQIDGFLAPELTRVNPDGRARLSPDQLLAGAQKTWPEYEITGFGARRDPALADLVFMIKRGDHEYRAGFLDPYTGEGRGDPINPSTTFTGILLELHYTWFADHVGMLITGIFAVMLCILGLTGFWMYRDFWRNFFTLRWNRSVRIFLSDAHKMVGISSVVFNLILGFTGAYWNIAHIVEEGLHHEEEEKVMAGRMYGSEISLNALAEAARKEVPGFRPGWVSLPSPAMPDIALWGRTEDGHFLTGPYGSHVMFDAQTGAVKSVHDLRTAGAWAQVVDTFTPLHFGTFGGWTIKILWVIGGLTPGVLAVTGFCIWRSRRRRAGTSAAAPAMSTVAEAR